METEAFVGKNKRKCDGQKPTCSLCQRGRRTCERKRYEPDYVRALEEQVEALKALVSERAGTHDKLAHLDPGRSQTLQMAQRSDMFEDTSPSASEQIRDETFATQSQHSKSQNHIGPDQRSSIAMEELGLMMLRLGINDEGEPSFTITTGQSSSSDSVAPQQEPHLVNSTLDSRSPMHVLENLALRRHLVGCFYQHFNPFHQVLTPVDVLNLEAGDYTRWSPDEMLRNVAVLAVGSHFSDHSDALMIGEQCAEDAEKMTFHCLRRYASYILVQGFSLLAWRDLTFGRDSMSWNFNSLATGLGLQLGIHVTALNKNRDERNPGISALQQRRIRSFWIYFSINRMVTSVLGMNCTMPWQRVRASLFSTILDGCTSVEEVAFCRHGQLWHLWDSLMDQTYAFDWPHLTSSRKADLLSRSQNALSSFQQQSDPILRQPNTSAIYYQLAFQAATILIHRPFFSEPIGTPTLSIALKAGTKAALEICHIIRSVKKTSSLADYLQHAINYIVCAAVIHLMNATCGRTALGRRSANNLGICMDALGDMGPRWKCRQQKAILFLRKMAHKWKVVWALPLQHSAPLVAEADPPSQSEGFASTTDLEMPEQEFSIWQFGDDGGGMEPEGFLRVTSELGWLFDPELQ
ncbi:hypothetical protein ACET3X_009503 [Alternaria dauci]|uniref:Xylanolytic transcriptional activator regulatory domain-containing protein n=1 Tax=Alternaria dauci TaxID=48095 RepID=A0ABR3U5V2_9PLEO